MARPEDFVDVPADALDRDRKVSRDVTQDTWDDDRAAFVVRDGNYVSASLAGRCSYIRSPVRQRFDRASRAGKHGRYSLARIPVTIVPLQSPATPCPPLLLGDLDRKDEFAVFACPADD